MTPTIEATWRGGPWDGVTIEVLRGERFFPHYVPTLSHCPVVWLPDGSAIIDWDAREVPAPARHARP